MLWLILGMTLILLLALLRHAEHYGGISPSGAPATAAPIRVVSAVVPALFLVVPRTLATLHRRRVRRRSRSFLSLSRIQNQGAAR